MGSLPPRLPVNLGSATPWPSWAAGSGGRPPSRMRRNSTLCVLSALREGTGSSRECRRFLLPNCWYATPTGPAKGLAPPFFATFRRLRSLWTTGSCNLRCVMVWHSRDIPLRVPKACTQIYQPLHRHTRSHPFCHPTQSLTARVKPYVTSRLNPPSGSLMVVQSAAC